MKLKNDFFSQLDSIKYAISVLKKKEIIIYPTESVFGIGCDPDSEIAVTRLLKLKKRPIEKGLILIAANFKQLKPYINDSLLTSLQIKRILTSVSNPITFIYPAKLSTPYWLMGRFDTIAARITYHPLVANLCKMFGKPLVSTSANFTGLSPCTSIQEVQHQFNDELPIVYGNTGSYTNPSEIRDLMTGKCLRKG